MYQGVSLDKEAPYGLTLIGAFLIRRSVFIAITYALIDYPALQIQVFILTSVLYMAYLNTFTIYEDTSLLKLELVNESIFLACCYQMLFFTNILSVEDPHTPEIIGICLIVSLSSLIGVAGLMIFLTSFKAIW